MTEKELPKPPYYAVIFTSQHTGQDEEGYENTGERMAALAETMPGFLGVVSTRNSEGFGITVSYWESEEAIRHWKANAEHTAARAQGRANWYEQFAVQVARVERAYGFTRSRRDD